MSSHWFLVGFVFVGLVTAGAVHKSRLRSADFRHQVDRDKVVKDSANSDDYNPLQLVETAEVQVLDIEFSDEKRNRDLPVRVYISADAKAPQPVVLFSHGLGGSRAGSTFLGKHWAARGYVAVFMQHPGSDESVWQGTRLRDRMQAMAAAATGEQLTLRVGDVSAVLDQLAKWNKQSEHALHQRLDLDRVGMSGHSFGAITTQNVSGQSSGLSRTSQMDSRIKAAIVMSPGVPAMGSPDRAFRNVKLPWLLMTGTHDDSPIGQQTPESRRKVFPALPTGDKYELVLHEAEHSIFTDRRLAGESQKRKPEHHQAILALSTAFWDAYLKENTTAKAWLQGSGAKETLSADDLWQFK